PKTGPVPISQSEGQSVASTVEAWNPTDAPMSVVAPPLDAPQHADTISLEKVRWDQALLTLGSSGIKEALGQLLEASTSAPSVRDQNRYRLLMAKLCLKAQRPDLARPIVEELHTLIEELNLERWESPKWVAEVLDALYQCLTSGEPSDDDMGRATVLFQRICTTDVTKAIIYKGRQ
ncbi:MAG: type VI secretion system domain-containing protein, partial [Desulfoferrobacter sp.]